MIPFLMTFQNQHLECTNKLIQSNAINRWNNYHLYNIIITNTALYVVSFYSSERIYLFFSEYIRRTKWCGVVLYAIVINHD